MFARWTSVSTVNKFSAYSWVLAKRLGGWLVGGKSCLSRVRLSVCPRYSGRGPPGPSVCRRARQERRDSAECIIQRRFAIRVDSVPSCKLGSARTRPRVFGLQLAVWKSAYTSFVGHKSNSRFCILFFKLNFLVRISNDGTVRLYDTNTIIIIQYDTA